MTVFMHFIYLVQNTFYIVIQVRVSDDFVSKTQWKIGISSLFVDSVGLAPFKDNFWSTSSQPGNPYSKTFILEFYNSMSVHAMTFYHLYFHVIFYCGYAYAVLMYAAIY